jgi:hypothetical protein
MIWAWIDTSSADTGGDEQAHRRSPGDADACR